MQQNIPTKDYQIQLSDSAGESFDQWMTDKSYSSIYVFMDENVMEKCWPVLHNDSEVLKSAEIIVIEAGEDQKDIEMAAQLWQTLMEYQADRKSLWINFGGGMISDLGGFVASTFKRGMDFINIPTTILSMVDASVGGKTAINMGSYKNQIGMFSSPKAIFMQANFIDSLSPKHQLSGWSEMLKHALIADKSHWTQLIKIKSLDSENLSPILADSIRIKKNIVEEDPLEKGNRKKLNFGHTIGHAIEAWSLQVDEQPLSHGEAVAIGMLCESYLSVKKDLLNQKDLDLMFDSFSSYFDKYELDTKLFDQLENYLNQDKKKEGKKLNLTFVTEIGQAVINQDCSVDEIIESIIFYKENY